MVAGGAVATACLLLRTECSIGVPSSSNSSTFRPSWNSDAVIKSVSYMCVILENRRKYKQKMIPIFFYSSLSSNFLGAKNENFSAWSRSRLTLRFSEYIYIYL